jgi:hypothetical protein
MPEYNVHVKFDLEVINAMEKRGLKILWIHKEDGTAFKFVPENVQQLIPGFILPSAPMAKCATKAAILHYDRLCTGMITYPPVIMEPSIP